MEESSIKVFFFSEMFPAQGHIEMDIYGLPWFFPADADADADADTDVDADVDTDLNPDAQDYERYKITSFFHPYHWG